MDNTKTLSIEELEKRVADLEAKVKYDNNNGWIVWGMHNSCIYDDEHLQENHSFTATVIIEYKEFGERLIYRAKYNDCTLPLFPCSLNYPSDIDGYGRNFNYYFRFDGVRYLFYLPKSYSEL